MRDQAQLAVEERDAGRKVVDQCLQHLMLVLDLGGTVLLFRDVGIGGHETGDPAPEMEG